MSACDALQYPGGASPGVRGLRSGLGLRTCSASASSPQSSGQYAAAPTAATSVSCYSDSQAGHDGGDEDGGDGMYHEETSCKRHSWSAHSASPRRINSVRRLSPFANDANQSADVESAAAGVIH